MKKAMISVFGLVATGLLVAALCGTAVAQEKQTARCTLTYKIDNMLSVNAEGPCTFFQTGDIVNVQGTVEENGQTYIANIDNSKNEGLLIGAGTFTLAHGKLTKNESTEVVWPNGYVLKIILK
ncbi:MAG: hypothetical protein BA862_05675 [Desulfobulbaceae bacterium S3730MH12]|nr:MAG: hypothetical protein BA866_11940 [Desulfobulbaceae bacterium S5133MH15]OEU58778.1 MAG: hypothetical protein BA862_05675 [Desulfobulbaceae bacterium S3730MH12]OEU81309.1 MAG: hypothetical protein BA873_13685 [Desulfobulbaceae bacterium C00003063]